MPRNLLTLRLFYAVFTHMEVPEGITHARVRKANSQLQDEQQYRFDEKGYKVPIEPVAVPVATIFKRPPIAPKKTVVAPAQPEAVLVPIAARPVELPPPDGTVSAMPNKAKRTQIQWNNERDELLLDKIIEHNALERGKMSDRFQLIADELFKLEAFKKFSIVKGNTFQKRYTD